MLYNHRAVAKHRFVSALSPDGRILLTTFIVGFLPVLWPTSAAMLAHMRAASDLMKRYRDLFSWQ